MSTKLMALTDETHPNFPYLRRLAFTRDYGGWLAGDRGGWAEHPSNVTGNAAVTDGAMVYGNAIVGGNARVYGNAKVFGKAQVFYFTRVYGNAMVFGDSNVCDNAVICDNARVSDGAMVYGNAMVSGEARVTDSAVVAGEAQITCTAEVLFITDVSTEGQPATLYRTAAGHQIIIGCWEGTTTELHELADSDRWPSGCDAATRYAHRPWLHAVADLFDARITTWRTR